MRFMLMTMILALSFGLAPASEQTNGSVKGRVVDLFGNPMVGVEVSISVDDRVEQRLVTDENGRYESIALQPATYQVSAALRGFHIARSKKYVGPGKPVVIELGLRPGHIAPADVTVITGTVRQTEGGKLSGVTVTIHNPYNDDLRQQTVTDSKGRFKFKVSDAGHYVLFTSPSNFNPASKLLTLPLELPKELVSDFELKPQRQNFDTAKKGMSS